MEPCMEIFLEAIKSDSAKDNYTRAMRFFKDFTKLETYQDIVDLDKKKLTQLIASYIIYRKKVNNPNSMGQYYHPIQTFLEMNDVLLNFKNYRSKIVLVVFPKMSVTITE